jgi:Nuclease-related domain
MVLLQRSRSGRYASDRYERGLRAYRRRIRWPLLIVVVPIFAFGIGVMLSHKIDRWSLAAGAAIAVGIAFSMYTLDEPPQHVQNWKRGGEGERRTEKTLKPLERNGWTVEHDVQREGRANLDHIVTGPPGVFLLETKNLVGTISVEDGVLVARQFDDPDEVYRYRSLAPRLRGQAKELSARLHAESGRRTWINAVAVVWGHFPQGLVSHENVTYVHGDQLRAWLTSRGR